MAINPLIALSGQMPDFGATVRNALERRDVRQERERVANNEQAQIDANRNAQRLASVQAFAQRIKPMVDAGDIEGAGRALIQRRTELRNQQAQGIPVDSNETDDLVRALKTGGAEGLKKYVDATLGFGEIKEGGTLLSGEAATRAGYQEGSVVWAPNDGSAPQILQSPQRPEAPPPGFTLGPNQTRFDAEGNELASVGPAPPSGPVSQTTVNVGPGENKATETFGTGVGERANARVTAAQEGVNQNQLLDRVSLALERGAQTGFGEEQLLDLKQFGATLGLDISEATNEQEVIRKITNEMALRLRNPESGFGLTGNTSNRDLTFLKDSVIGLSRSEGGNRLMIDFMKRQNQMKGEIAQEQARIIAENAGVVPNDLDTRLMKFVNDYQFFTPEERALVEAAANRGSAQSAESASGGADAELEERVRRLREEVAALEAQ